MQARSPFPIPIFSLNLSTHSTNPLPVSAQAWLSKTPQIHPPTLMRTCKSGHLFHTHTQYTFHTHFYYHHSLSTPPCTHLISLFRSSYPHFHTILHLHAPCMHPSNSFHITTFSLSSNSFIPIKLPLLSRSP